MIEWFALCRKALSSNCQKQSLHYISLVVWYAYVFARGKIYAYDIGSFCSVFRFSFSAMAKSETSLSRSSSSYSHSAGVGHTWVSIAGFSERGGNDVRFCSFRVIHLSRFPFDPALSSRIERKRSSVCVFASSLRKLGRCRVSRFRKLDSRAKNDRCARIAKKSIVVFHSVTAAKTRAKIIPILPSSLHQTKRVLSRSAAWYWHKKAAKQYGKL